MNVPAYSARLPGVRAPETHAPSVATATRQNWLFYAFLLMLPLQNLHTGYIPNLGGGFNFLNIGFGQVEEIKPLDAKPPPAKK